MSIISRGVSYQAIVGDADIAKFTSEAFGFDEVNNKRSLMLLYKTNPKKYLNLLKEQEDVIQEKVQKAVKDKYDELGKCTQFKDDGKADEGKVALSEHTKRTLALKAGEVEKEIQMALLHARFPINSFSDAVKKVEATIQS